MIEMWSYPVVIRSISVVGWIQPWRKPYETIGRPVAPSLVETRTTPADALAP